MPIAHLPQGDVHYREFGPADGPAVLFVHGVLANGLLWYDVAERLENVRCIVPDWPLGAHSVPLNRDADLSTAGVVSLIIALLDSLKLERVTLVGNDSGGALCQLIIARHPERLHRVVLTSCDAYDIWLPLLFKYFEFAAFIPGALWLLATSMRWRPLRRLPIALGWLAKRLPRATSDAFTAPLARSAGVRADVAKFLKAISPKDTLAAAAHFRTFTAPVLIAWSREDRFFPLNHAHRLQAAFPHAELKLIDDAYTFSPLDNPAALAAAMNDFFKSNP